MALPSNGPISMSQVATELGMSATGLSLGTTSVRNLAGRLSGTISMSDLRGKSAMSVVGHNSLALYESNGASGRATAFPYVTVTGGVEPYTYQWAFTSNTNPAFQFVSNNVAQVQVYRNFTRYQSFYASCTLQCTVTDATGRAITVGGITGSVEVESNA